MQILGLRSQDTLPQSVKKHGPYTFCGLFRDKVSCNSGWPPTCYLAHVDLKHPTLLLPPLNAGYWASAAMPGFIFKQDAYSECGGMSVVSHLDAETGRL